MSDQDQAQDQEPTVDDAEAAEAAEEIRARAYEISQSGESGTPEENWQRAEREVGQGGPGAARQS